MKQAERQGGSQTDVSRRSGWSSAWLGRLALAPGGTTLAPGGTILAPGGATLAPGGATHLTTFSREMRFPPLPEAPPSHAAKLLVSPPPAAATAAGDSKPGGDCVAPSWWLVEACWPGPRQGPAAGGSLRTGSEACDPRDRPGEDPEGINVKHHLSSAG